MNPFPDPSIPVPALSARQMQKVDRVMEEDLGIGLVQMMENAGRGLARLCVERFLGGDPGGKDIVALAGKGGNGGGVLVASRRLAGWGARVHVRVAGAPEDLGPVPALQLRILNRMGVDTLESTASQATAAASQAAATVFPPGLGSGSTETEPALVLDGLVGYSLAGPPRGEVADWIRWTQGKKLPVVSLDLPSGLDATTGEALSPCVRAAATLSLALPKTGLREERAREWVGELYLGDIGVPPKVYRQFDMNADGLFSNGDLLFLGP